MKKYIKMLIAAAVIMTLITPSAGIGNVLAADENITVNEQSDAPDSQDPVSAAPDSPESVPAADDSAGQAEFKAEVSTDAAGDDASDVQAEDTSEEPQAENDKSGDEEDPDDNYNEWQTDIDEYDAEENTKITFVLSGTSTVTVKIDSIDDDFSDDIHGGKEKIYNGDTRELRRGSHIFIQGEKDKYIRAAFGFTKEEAVSNPEPEISKLGQSVSVAQDGTGYIYILVSSHKDVIEKGINTRQIADDEQGTITYSDVSVADAMAGITQSAFPTAGQSFTGMATLTDHILRSHGSVGYMRPDNGWLKENTTLRSIAAVCISGPAKSMANKKARFIYVCKILEADPKTGKVKIGITFKPLSNKNNVTNGYLDTQILYKATYVTLHPKTGFVTLTKKQAARNYDYVNTFPGNYTLAGAVYRLYLDAGCTMQACDANGNGVEFVTGPDGSTSIVEIEPGTYYAREIAPSNGFKLDKTVRGVTVTADNDINSPAVIVSEEEPGYADLGIMLIKENDNYGYKRLIGTKYELSYYDTDPANPVINSSTLKATWVYKARYMETADGLKTAGIDFAADEPVSGKPYTEGGKKIMPLGVIKLRETEAPKGLAVDKTVYTGSIRLSGDNAKLSVNGQDSLIVRYDDKLTHDEEYKKIKLQVSKVDAETGQPAAEGADREYSKGSLAGAVYEVWLEDTDLDKNEKVGEIITDENGCGTLDTDSRTGDKLRPGRYFIKETKASPGYVTDVSFEEEKKNKYEEGSHIVLARADLDNSRQVYDYEVTSHEQHHETYISKTDAVTGKELPGAKLQVINSDGNIVEEWISGREPRLIKALPDGKYTLREITAPYGYDVAEDAEFEVTADKVTNKVTMKNRPVTIGTQAKDIQTGTHHGLAGTAEKITDTVKMTGLTKGRKYRVSGRLINRETGGMIPGAEAETEFEADAEEKTVVLEFTVDSSLFTGTSSVVAYEKLFRISKVHDIEEEEIPVELQKHEDPGDEDQIIHYGGIAYTIATGEDGKHLITGDKDTLIIDTVAYSNLSPKQEYRLVGELYDQTDGRSLGITAEAAFTPQTSDGTAEVRFRLDTRDLADHAVVAFETLFTGGILISEHKDPNDEAQTVYIIKEPAEKSAAPKTGDDNMLKIYEVITVLAAAELIFIYACRRRKRRR